MAALDEYRSNAEQLAKTAVEKTALAQTLPSRIKDVINEKLEGNRAVIEQRAAAESDYFGAGDVARDKYADVIDPRKKEFLVNQYKTQALTPYSAWNQVLENRQGTIADIIGQVSAAAQADATRAYGASDIARQSYLDMLAEYQYEQEQAYRNQQLALQRESLANTIRQQNKPKEPDYPTLNEILKGKEMGLNWSGETTDVWNRMIGAADLPEEPATATEYAPILQEQLMLGHAGNNTLPLSNVIDELNRLGYDPYSASGGPLYDTLLRWYPEIAKDYEEPKKKWKPDLGGNIRGAWNQLSSLWGGNKY